jgi:hypothetical protein
MIPIKKLSQDDKYIRPEKTITESIQNKKDIEEKLNDFEEISDEDLNFINVNTLLRYISYDKKDKKELFRFGGLLVKVNREYIVLSGKEGLRFSVQRYTRNDKNDIIHRTRFFKKVKETEVLKNQLEEVLEKTSDKIDKQNEIIEKQKKEIMAMKKKLSKLT